MTIGESTTDGHPTYRQYRAPRTPGDALLEPSIGEAAEDLSVNLAIAASEDSFWQTLRSQARTDLVREAVAATKVYRDVSWAEPLRNRPIVMAGHQPTLFHPGVWFKNFVLHEVASRSRSLPINLVVDNDVGAECSIRVPPGMQADAGDAAMVIQYDRPMGGLPFEQSVIEDRHLFDQFDDRVLQATAGWIDQPCVVPLWRYARTAADRSGGAACSLAQARHALEADIGLKTLELPLSTICRGSAFARFALAILAEAELFREGYNRSTDQYRRAHGIRSASHPVPNLATEGNWCEVPFWIYSDRSPQRRAAWVCRSGATLWISDQPTRQGQAVAIDLSDSESASEQLVRCNCTDWKLRPRALITTMFARLVLSDLFIHGIGGAKYDQLGDEIAAGFFHVKPRRLMVVSATVWLPGVKPEPHAEQIREIQTQIRDTYFRGERFVEQLELDPVVLSEKRRLLENIPPPGQRKAWHDRITRLNQGLSETLAGRRSSLVEQLSQAKIVQQRWQRLASREHPFCLFPLDYLTETFQQMIERSAN